MHTKLLDVVNESRIWEGSRKYSHQFLLSPDVYRITKDQYRELSMLGYSLYDCLLGLSHMATIAYNTELNYRGVWKILRDLFSTGVPQQYKLLQGMNVADIPRLLKLDLLVNHEGRFRIAEIDGHNKHGLGYSTLGKRLRQSVVEQVECLPGVVRLLSDDIRSMGYDKLTILYGDRERFYVPEFEIAQDEFARHGIICDVVAEADASPAQVSAGILLDLPFLFNRNAQLYNPIVTAYKQGQVSFIIPPKPFLGAKSVLALLRNDVQDNSLESVLATFIPAKSLSLVRSYIPETRLVGMGSDWVEAINQSKRFVLKESISSGMKGVYFSDDVEFESVMRIAQKANMNWILQEEVLNKPQTFSWYRVNGGEPELCTANDWNMRVTAQYVKRQLGDIIVTARRDKAVHGAKDCLQLGTIIEG